MWINLAMVQQLDLQRYGVDKLFEKMFNHDEKKSYFFAISFQQGKYCVF